MSSISVACLENLEGRLDHDFEVEQQRPVIDIPKVKADALCDLGGLWCCAAAAIALRPPGNAGFDVVTEGVFANNFFELIVMGESVRARTDDRHVAAKHVEKLRQFINA